MVIQLQQNETNMVNGAACVCTKVGYTITTFKNIEDQTSCEVNCCDSRSPAIKWELFTMPDVAWIKNGYGVCRETRQNTTSPFPLFMEQLRVATVISPLITSR